MKPKKEVNSKTKGVNSRQIQVARKIIVIMKMKKWRKRERERG